LIKKKPKQNRIPHYPHYGVSVRLKPSKHGVGVFAIADIPKGTYVFYGDDAPIAWIDIDKINNLGIDNETKKLYEDFAIIKGNKYGCPKNFNQLTISWYLNHSKNPNMACDKEYRFYALRKIKKGKELTANYETYNESKFDNHGNPL
jgi:SET domain-containing protein